MRAAKIIIIVPALSPGSWWELETAVGQVLCRVAHSTVPPVSSLGLEALPDALSSMRQRWAELPVAAKRVGLEFPAFSGERFDVSSSPDRVASTEVCSLKP